MTKGDGYVDPDDEAATMVNQEDEGETMRTVLKSKGLAGIFDHDVVEGKSKEKKASIREMETRAKQIAREALQNLQKSVEQEQNPFNQESRFGGASAQSNSLLSSIANRNAQIANATSVFNQDEIQHHTQLLKDLKIFIHDSTPTTDEILVSEILVLENSIFALLILNTLLIFPKNTIVVTHQGKFSSHVSTRDAAVFRKLLKSIAILRDGIWTLR